MQRTQTFVEKLSFHCVKVTENPNVSVRVCWVEKTLGVGGNVQVRIQGWVPKDDPRREGLYSPKGKALAFSRAPKVSVKPDSHCFP